MKPSGGQARKEEASRVTFSSMSSRGRMGVVALLVSALGLSPFGAGLHSQTRRLSWSSPGDHHQLGGISAQAVLYWTAAGNSWAWATVVSEKPSGKCVCWASLKGSHDLIIQDSTEMLASLVLCQVESGKAYLKNNFKPKGYKNSLGKLWKSQRIWWRRVSIKPSC